MLIALAVLTVAVFQPFLVALLWAAVFVTATDRIHVSVLRRTGNRKTLAAALMTALVLFAIITPLSFCAVTVIGEANDFYEVTGPQIVEQLREPIAKAEAWIRMRYKASGSLSGLLEPGRFALGMAQSTIQGVFAAFATLFFLVLSLFYFYRDGHVAVRVAKELVPLKEADRNLVFSELRDAVNAAVVGGLLTAVVQGTLGMIILWILDINGAVFWGAVMALASLIPLVGTALVWVPIAVFLAWQGEHVSAAILTGYGIFVIALADNLLRPIFIGQRMKAHSLLLFFGVLGSMLLFGFKGIVLGPIVVAGLTATTTLFRREFARGRA